MTRIAKNIATATILFFISANAAFSTGIFEYDGQKGWWWYKEVIEKNGEKYKIKTKFSPKEKLLFEQKIKQNKLLEKQTKLLKKINERLQYAFPDLTPKYGINEKTGEKCLANSSADCFVMPLQPEAQHVPVLANFLRDPNPKNSEEYLKWQAKYFNHVTNVSYGIRFAFLSKGAEAYPTDAAYMYTDNPGFPISDDIRRMNQLKILNNLKDKIGIMIFLGKNTALEETNTVYRTVYNYQKKGWKDISISVVFPSEKMKKFVMEKAKEGFLFDKGNKTFWERAKVMVRPDLFEKFNVTITPSVLAVYKLGGKNKKYIWQTVSTGSIAPKDVREGIFRFLVYNKVIDPKDLSIMQGANFIQKNVKSEPIKVNENKVYSSTGVVKLIKESKKKDKK